MKLIKVKDYSKMCEVASDILVAEIIKNPNATLGLATGSTPIGIYKNLIKAYKESTITFKNIKTINLDEYVGLPKSHDQSYAYFMNDNLFNHIDIDKLNTNIPDGMADNTENECEHYEQIIDNLGIDIQILGIGSNGHIGFNEPSQEFFIKTHKQKLSATTIADNSRFFDNIEDVPTSAITMGIGSIMKAKCILLLASGKAKKTAIHKLLTGNVTPDLPASILNFHPNVYLIADEEALN